jgi:vacuolar protein sorting-associated protein 45
LSLLNLLLTFVSAKNESIDSLEGIRRFLQDYPQFRKLSTNVSKHVTLMSQLSSVVDQRSLMEVSAREQELACKDSHAAHLKMLEEVIDARGECERVIDRID